MYPIPPSRSLMLCEIADHWSRKIKPRRSQEELLRDLGQAFWRGEFMPVGETTRLKLLTALFNTSRAAVPFWIKGKKRPQTEWVLQDGSVEFINLSVLPVPSVNPENWTDVQCLEAYEGLAQDWGSEAFAIISPIVSGILLTEPEFTSWTKRMGYKRPKFWASNPLLLVELAAPSAPPLPKNRPGKPNKFVKQYITNEKASGGRPTKEGLEAAAKTAGIRGGRDERRDEFNRQMGGDAPVRGRPTK